MDISVTKTPKVNDLLTTAKTLFYKYGFKRVTVEEICSTAGVSKVTFYKNFKNKDELFIFIIAEMYREGLDNYNEIMNSDLTFKAKVEKFIEMKKHYADSMSVDMMKDMYVSSSEQVRNVLNGLFAEAMDMNRQFFMQAQKDGDIRSNANIEFIMFFINKIIEWADNDELLTLFDSPKDMAVELINFLFYGMVGQTEVHV